MVGTDGRAICESEQGLGHCCIVMHLTYCLFHLVGMPMECRMVDIMGFEGVQITVDICGFALDLQTDEFNSGI